MNLSFDASSPENQQVLAKLENLKTQGWKVTDAGRDPGDPNILLVTMDKTIVVSKS